MSLQTEFAPYLSPAEFIDSDHPDIIAYTQAQVKPDQSPLEQAVSLYYTVRDGWRYDPYRVDLRPDAMRASAILKRDHGHCIDKATVFAAGLRTLGIPSRLLFANVRNHIATSKLEEFLGSNVLVFHGYSEVYLEGRWVKATPAFNLQLCEHIGVAPLDFDGRTDSMFQEYDQDKGRFMEYLHFYGDFPDVPRDLFIASLKKHYGHLFDPEKLKSAGVQVYL
ncbi:MAG: transglutaminase-like domain-containing protein [Bacteroidota bacterium]